MPFQLPNMFAQRDYNTGNRPQAQQMPNPVGGQMANLQSQMTGQQGQRPVFSQMGPDNGQHGGPRRYMTPESGAMMQSRLQQQNGTQRPMGLPNIPTGANRPQLGNNNNGQLMPGQFPTMPQQQHPPQNIQGQAHPRGLPNRAIYGAPQNYSRYAQLSPFQGVGHFQGWPGFNPYGN